MRTYFHVDMDAFFVSVEELFDPSLKGKPVVVGGRPDERGVVSAASYAARKFGVHSAMPLRTAYKLCPQAIFVDGHPDRYRECSHQVYQVLQSFSPLVEMASIDEAYLDMTGTERLYGPPLRAAHVLHQRMKAETRLNCSVGIASSRLVAKITSDQAKPNGILWVAPGQEAAFLAPLDVRKVPGVGKVTEKNLHTLGIRKVGDLARLDEDFLEQRFGKWGLALAGKARGLDAGGWFDTEIGADVGPKSISHEHTYHEDTADLATLERRSRGFARWWAGGCASNGLHARTHPTQATLSDFSTITRAHSVRAADATRYRNLRRDPRAFPSRIGGRARRCGCLVCTCRDGNRARSRSDLLGGEQHERWNQAMAAADRMRDRFGESAVSLAASMRGKFRERTHENPVGLPGKKKEK